MRRLSARATGVALLAALILGFSNHAPGETRTSVLVGGRSVQVTVADTDRLREKGLSGHPGLSPDEGMLFVFDIDGKPGFWMKDMRFSIDIVWLDQEGKIVYIVRELAPGTYPKTYAPPVPSRYVLELPAGFVRKHNVRVGNVVRWPQGLH